MNSMSNTSVFIIDSRLHVSTLIGSSSDLLFEMSYFTAGVTVLILLSRTEGCFSNLSVTVITTWKAVGFVKKFAPT